jgi:hypothetical protein
MDVKEQWRLIVRTLGAPTTAEMHVRLRAYIARTTQVIQPNISKRLYVSGLAGITGIGLNACMRALCPTPARSARKCVRTRTHYSTNIICSEINPLSMDVLSAVLRYNPRHRDIPASVLMYEYFDIVRGTHHARVSQLVCSCAHRTHVYRMADKYRSIYVSCTLPTSLLAVMSGRQTS